MHNGRQLVTKFVKTFNKFCIVIGILIGFGLKTWTVKVYVEGLMGINCRTSGLRGWRMQERHFYLPY